MKRSAAVCAAAWAAAVSWACSDVTVQGGAPLFIELTADRTTATVGQNVAFDYDARGSILDGVIIVYGDGVADTAFTSGAITAHGRFLHAYSAAGTFTAVGTVYDAVQGHDSTKVVIQVTGG